MTTTEQLQTASGWTRLEDGVEINPAAWTPDAECILAPAVGLVARLERELADERQLLLEARRRRQAEFDAGGLPGYLDDEPGYLDDEVAALARSDWRVAPLPEDLLCRRVEITGPISDTKMVINMLSRTAGGERADAAMLDFEDSMKPSWPNVIAGVHNLIGAAEGTLSFVKPAADGRPEKHYRLDPDDMPLLMARCRGLHLDEANLQVDGRPVSGGLLDLALSAFHTAGVLLGKGKTPKYYVPKVEHHLEARWWNRLLTSLERELGYETSTLRATFLIETLPAAFQMEEILFELREHAAGLNVGRWDKIFSDIKVLREHPDRVMADRASISLNRPWMHNYAERLVKICHRHGAFAMGGMAAFTPGGTAELREAQTRKVVEDKQLEASLGHDGCWVSHPYFIGPALSGFTNRNQLDVAPTIDDRPELLPTGGGPYTMAGLRTNVRVGIAYLQGWIRDIGCVAWDNLMEDLATLEISRAQTWQWLRHGVELDEGGTVDGEMVAGVFAEELARILDELGLDGSPGGRGDEAGSWREAAALAERIFTESDFRPFLTSTSELVGGERKL